jgi:hypothetical protein
MNDFENVLELRLKHLLDPVVASRPPSRRSRDRRRPFLTVLAGGELAMETVPVVESVVTARVTTAR